MYMTNSVGANKKIIKNIIRDTIKKIIVKSISSSDENTSNANILSKESEKGILGNNTLKEKNQENKNNNNINNSQLNKDKTNLYENGTSSYYLLNNRNNENQNNLDNIDNITLSKLIPQETKTINIFEDINNNNVINTHKLNSNEFKEETNIDIQKDKFLETTNSNIFSDLQIKSNNNNNDASSNNDDISLSYSKNLQNEEDDKQFKLLENKLDKKLQEIKNENNIELNIDNSNLDIKIYENRINFDSKNNEIDNITNKNSFNLFKSDNNDDNNINNIDDIHKKKISNGNVNQSNKRTKLGIDSYSIKQLKYIYNYKHKTLNNSLLDNYLINKSEDLNGVNNSIKKKIFKKYKINNKSEIYLNRRKQLSYHLNNINNISHNNIKEVHEDKNKYIDDILMNKVTNTINVNDKENYNPNRISIKNQSIYKNKNNIINGWYNITSNKSFKSTLKSKNSNKFFINNIRGSKISLTKSGSCQNMNPPPIGGLPNKDAYISPSSNSITSLNNIITNNSNSNNNRANYNNKLSINNTFINNTSFSTSKPKHSSLNKKGNINNVNSNNTNSIKNIPINNNNNEKIILNPYRKNNIQKNSNIFLNNNLNYDLDESVNNNINNKLKNISTEELIKLRDFLISCDLLCYYNLLIIKNMYHIDNYIKDIQNKIQPFTYETLEEIGIKKPGHIYRILIKLDIDAGIIDNNLYCYIIDKINFNSVTSTIALTSSINGGFCCGVINLCPKDNYYNNKKIKNGAIYYNDLSSFLRANELNRLKGNFIHNGFDKIEFVIIQQFSKYAFDKKILNEYLHIYIDSDKNKLLNILVMIKNNLMKEYENNFGKKENNINYLNNDLNSAQNKNSYKVYEFSSAKNNNEDNDNDINNANFENFKNKEEKRNKSSNLFCNIF